jgi:hypothetical protein
MPASDIGRPVKSINYVKNYFLFVFTKMEICLTFAFSTFNAIEKRDRFSLMGGFLSDNRSDRSCCRVPKDNR